MPTGLRLHSSGAFDIALGDVRLADCWPGIDGRPLRARSVRVCAAPARIEYELEQGMLWLEFSELERGLILRCGTCGFPETGVLSPVGFASVSGVDRVFCQGLHMGATPGLVALDELGDGKAGYGLAALGRPGGYAVLCCADCTRFLTRFLFTRGAGFAPHYCCGFGQSTAKRAVLASIDIMLEGQGGDIVLPELRLEWAGVLEDGLRAGAQVIAARMGARDCAGALFHWCSWYYQYHNFDQQLLEEYCAGFKAQHIPFRFIQIDVGYCTTQGDWLKPSHHFPQGLEHAAGTIRQSGYEPGIWIGPFMVGDESDIVKDHPDWLLHDLDGSLHVQWRFYGEPKLWGQRDCDYYVLDTSNPAALKYLKHVFATLRGWGYRLFKTDFMTWGLHDSRTVRRYAPGRTGVEYFREALAAIREAIGEDAVWLGCIAPFMPFIGYADAMRIGGDVGAQWNDNDFGPVNMIHEIVSDHYFNGVYWRNDPDVVLLRDRHIYLSDSEVEALALLQAMSGGVIATSDPMHLTSDARRELLRFIRPDRTHAVAMPYFECERDVYTFVNEVAGGALVYLFNPTGQSRHVALRLGELLPADAHELYVYGQGACEYADVLHIDVGRHSGWLLFASRSPLAGQPENIWVW